MKYKSNCLVHFYKYLEVQGQELQNPNNFDDITTKFNRL